MNLIPNLGSLKLPPMPRWQVKVIETGWYGPDKQPVRLGETIAVDADLAYALVRFGKVERVK